MVTVIHQSKSLHNAVNYNEQKVQAGKAICLLAVNYPKDPEDLNFYQKLHRLTNQAALRPRTKVNSLHISINFEPSEKLSRETLEQIARNYMDRIGFGQQPYLVYEHRDAGHPHLHVVTTNITPDGKRIGLHYLGKNQSEQARKAIEKEFGLIRAQDQKQKAGHELKAASIKKVVYGQSDTRRAIMNVLDAVLDKYKYTSLEELNAILRTANVQASRGNPSSRTYQTGGLVYQVLDEQGKPAGCRIKASAFYNKPTLPFLQERFTANAAERAALEKRLRLAVDWYFLKSRQPTREGLKGALEKEGITLVQYTAKDGRIFGVSYIDHKTGGVFKGSDLGKEYASEGIGQRMNPQIETPAKNERQRSPSNSQPPASTPRQDHLQRSVPEIPAWFQPASSSGPEKPPPSDPHVGLPYELQENERKRRRRKRLRL
ncbi:relaxase/mobilization nuclease domain-containing protein [Puia sp. P3]|uniref:relaxase/mobilization nuclease domain-containing protein n=1 Tax=Puia sp. P3 TaxID=3423952 RepID=UPI003D67D6AA